MLGGSWPFAVVRKTRSGNRICFSCHNADSSCRHAAAATTSAQRSAQRALDSESDPDSASDGSEVEGVDAAHAGASMGNAAGPEGASGIGSAAEQIVLVDRSKEVP